MEKTIQIENRDIQVFLSGAADRQLRQLSENLLIEMELYFSCLLRKRVRFSFGMPDKNTVPISEKCGVKFTTKSGERCDINEGPKLVEIEIAKRSAFVPRWLKIDYRAGQWVGEFGFDPSAM